MPGQREDAIMARVQQAAKLGILKTTNHSRARMEERNATVEDVRRAILTATVVIEQPKENTIRLEGGKDIDGEDLAVVVAEDARGLRIVTVM